MVAFCRHGNAVRVCAWKCTQLSHVWSGLTAAGPGVGVGVGVARDANTGCGVAALTWAH